MLELGMGGLQVNPRRHREFMAHVEVQFAPTWIALQEEHLLELRQAQFRARQTHNRGALLPAEAAAYVSHSKALTVARAKCIADTYSAFDEPTGSEAEQELSGFFSATVAARKASFRANAELRQTRTRELIDHTQLSGCLRGFEREASAALLEARAILDKQRVEVRNRPPRATDEIKYVVDTCVFNWLTDSLIGRDTLPSDGGFAITHIQVDEINKTSDEERRARLLLTQTSLRCKLLPTETFVFDLSRQDHAKWGDGQLFTSMKAELDKLNGGKNNNNRDALIAEAAIANRCTLLTSDRDLSSATRKHGGKVIFYEAPK